MAEVTMDDTILPMRRLLPDHTEDLLPEPVATQPEPVVATLVEGQWAAFEVAIALEIFGIRRGEVLRHPNVDGWYDVRLCGPEPQVAGPAGVTISVPHRLDVLASADVVIVPYCAKPADVERRPVGRAEPMPVSEDAVEALRAAHDRGATLLSFCSGAFALAQAGLLDGRPATTHWMYARSFTERFPKVRFTPDVLYVDDGEILTSAGSAAGIDLSLHFIRRRHGADVADLVARRMVVPPHRDGGQAQYLPALDPAPTATPFAELLEWMLGNLDRDLSVAELARRSAMSPRSFARHFQQATGTTPHRWLTARRVDRARQLLETTDWPVDRVAAASGLGTAANLRSRLSEAIGVTPTAYRSRFART